MSVPVSIHIAIPAFTASIAWGSSSTAGPLSKTPVAQAFGNKSVAIEVYDLIVSYNKGIRDL